VSPDSRSHCRRSFGGNESRGRQVFSFIGRTRPPAAAAPAGDPSPVDASSGRRSNGPAPRRCAHFRCAPPRARGPAGAVGWLTTPPPRERACFHTGRQPARRAGCTCAARQSPASCEGHESRGVRGPVIPGRRLHSTRAISIPARREVEPWARSIRATVASTAGRGFLQPEFVEETIPSLGVSPDAPDRRRTSTRRGRREKISLRGGPVRRPTPMFRVRRLCARRSCDLLSFEPASAATSAGPGAPCRAAAGVAALPPPRSRRPSVPVLRSGLPNPPGSRLRDDLALR